MSTAYVVLTYNRGAALLAVLRGLAPQCGRDDVVVIADDGSRPDQFQPVRESLPRFACPVRHVWHPDLGFTAARARNLGALRAGAPYIVFMDGDCVPNRHFARQHALLARAGHFVNGSRVLLSQAFSEQVMQGTVNLDALGVSDWLRLRLKGDINKLSHLVRWPDAPGREEGRFRWKGIRSCNFGVWYRDLEAVNGFDETFSGWGHEDADLVLRLHHAGLRRRNGFFGTEVFHLWHLESSRAAEPANRQRVLERLQSGMVRAERGLAQAAGDAQVVVTEWNG